MSSFAEKLIQFIGRIYFGFKGKEFGKPGKFETFALRVGITADYRLGVRLRTSRMGVANLERSRTTMEAEKRER